MDLALKKKESDLSEKAKTHMAKINGFEFISPDKWRFLKDAAVEQAAQRAAEYEKRNFHFDNLEHHVEEYLRQWGLMQLIEVYGYPENWLWLSNASKRNANIVIKDENNRSLALVAARYFGETDLDFEKAGHELQSDLEDIETVRFGIVTDGRRIAFLCKNVDEQIDDYKTIADFPVYQELRKYVETNQFPELPATAHKFQKLPAPKVSLKTNPSLNSGQSVAEDPIVVSAFNSKSFNRRTFAAILSAVLLILLGAWYITRSEPRADAQVSPFREINQPPENSDKTIIKSPGQNAAADKPVSVTSISPARQPRRTTQNVVRQSAAPREIASDGTLKLNQQDINAMQSRPTGASPSSRSAQSKIKNSAAATAIAPLPKDRRIIRQPFMQ